MSMLARYKKGGGIIELVKLIEDSAEPKRSQLMQMIRAEDADFAARVETKIFSFEKLKTLPESYLAEILSSSPVKFVAIALSGESPEFITFAEKCLGKQYNEYKQEKEALKAAPPSAGQIETARRKVIAEARKLESAGAIKLSNTDGDGAPLPGAAPTPAPTGASFQSSPVPSAPGGVATAEGGCPPVESFGLEAPPPGLSGERFETFLKSLLT